MQYYFSIEIVDDELVVCISPKDYTDKHHALCDEHLGETTTKSFNANLPFFLSEDAECMFSVWDNRKRWNLTPSDINFVRQELLNLDFIEKNPNEWLQ